MRASFAILVRFLVDSIDNRLEHDFAGGAGAPEGRNLLAI
jgi:hypothetical protein